ncbi:Fip1 motif-domain-containing protein [Echria macrotheca]|uniref:Fip1 motif-domain-containing protein n=1 Tax=Echria macrotheca TaxID=438768 RepID=A0AAJ0BJB9_9PEZI|nr:Fip1 motif-domain-containing protein [Echria macrotheca]
MDIDEDDDFYGTDEPEVPAAQPAPAPATTSSKPDAVEELEEGEEEDEGGDMDEGDDSDIDIVVETKDTSKAAPPSQSRYSDIRNIPQRSVKTDTIVKPAPVKREERKSSADQLPASRSKIDVNAIPIHKPTGKPLTQVNIDEDLADHDKPWRKPGTDLSDYFNYGFDEFTWALYAQKQEALRGEYNQDALAQSNKKMMEEMANMMMMSGMMPGMAGAPGAGAAGPAPGMAGMEGMGGMEGSSPEMQAMMAQMMAQMMASGVDPSQMDPSQMDPAMAAMFGNMQNAAAAGGGGVQGGQGQNFGAGFGGNQGQGYGYDQQMGGNTQGGGGGGGRGGRGRGRRSGW